jgi:hypothetical protein
VQWAFGIDTNSSLAMQNANHNDGTGEEESLFTEQLYVLGTNAPSKFSFSDAFTTDNGAERRWTNHEDRQVVKALENNKTVGSLEMNLAFCPWSLTPNLLPYLRNSPILENVSIRYSLRWRRGDRRDSLPVQEEYHRQIDGILCATLQNPAVRHLTTNQLGRNPHLYSGR